MAGIFLEAASLKREEGTFRPVKRLWEEGIERSWGDCNAVSDGESGAS